MVRIRNNQILHAMKKITLWCLFGGLFLIFPNTLKGQDYFPFPSDSATWYSMRSQYEMIPPYISYYTIKYEIIGDTILNNKTYHKVYQSSPDSTNSHLSYTGALRTEPDSLLVYYINRGDSGERLLYNYNLLPNDTLIMRGFQHICIDTGSIILNNNIKHKIQYMYIPENDCLQTWVMGIGSLGIPLLEPYWAYCAYAFEITYDLTCFSYKNELIYEWDMNPYFTGCIGGNTGGIEELSIESLQVVPNPVQGISRLSGYGKGTEKVNYQVLDITGRTLYERHNVSYMDIEIKGSDYRSGIYFLQLYNATMEKPHILTFQIR